MNTMTLLSATTRMGIQEEGIIDGSGDNDSNKICFDFDDSLKYYSYIFYYTTCIDTQKKRS